MGLQLKADELTSGAVREGGPEPGADAPARTTRPLRIAFLSYRSDPKVGGQGVYLSAAAEALARRGHQVEVISGPPYPELPAGVSLVKLPSLDLYAQPHNGHRALRWRHLLSWTDTAEFFGHLSGKFMEPWSFGRRAARYLATHGAAYDVVLDNQTLCYGLLDIQAAGLPVVEVIHHPIRRDLELALASEPDKGKRWLMRRWYDFLTMQEAVAPRLKDILVVSESSRRDVAECLKAPLEAMTVAPLGIDLDVFRPLPGVTRAPARLLTTASADVPLKGLKFLIEAYARLLETRPALELVVIGKLREGPTAALIERLGVKDRVRFISDLTRQAVVEAYAGATICVTPSLYEGFGLPAAEAMACGAPVVVTDGGALPEVVGPGGVVVPKGDAGALAGAIGALLDDPGRRADLAAAGLAWARERFRWERTAAVYEEVLWRAVDRRC
jgi:glycosyltransferase involved in cell wall biosynthesis